MSGYDRTFFESHRDGARSSAEVLVPELVRLVAPHSVVDVGCGTGAWLGVFRRHGVDDVLGIDQASVDPDVLDIPEERFVAHDLHAPLRLGRTFDLAISLEVAEHLPTDAASAFVSSLVRLSACVLFSAAIPHQGGHAHVNEQWPAYWERLFAAHDYLPIDCFRRRLWLDDRVEWWYAQNVLLYVRRDRLAADPVLTTEHMRADEHPLPLVHPTRFLQVVRWAAEQR